MEARVEARARHFYGLPPPDLRALGKRSSEWDANDWKWDGDLFLARPLNPITPDYASRQFFPPESRVPAAGNSSNSSSSCSEEVNLGIENGKMELEKRGRVIVIEDDHLDDKANGLTLKLGGQGYTVAEREVETWEGNHGKKTKLVGGSTSRAVCQVEDCGADLSNAKDYHRRHKVCEMHSKASQALVGSIRQRFCQQCSRFHALQEFDEGKRSCRRRLAGHNKRRRKTNPDVAPNANSINDEQASSYLLISLLKILSSMHSNQPKQATDQDLLSHILRSLAGNSAGHGEKSIAGLLQESQAILNGGASLSKSEVVHPMPSTGLEGPSRLQTQAVGSSSQIPANMRDRTGGQSKMNNFDLNDAYIDSDDGTEDLGRLPVPANPGTSSLDCPSWMQQESHQSSPPQTSGTSDSASAQSPSSSSGDTQSRTDRIVFKLFGKEPNDFPLLLRAQILDWLSHSPTDIESYIRPGCVVLTLYLRQAEDAWEELRYDLSSSLNRLLDVSDDIFWKTGWMFIRVQNQMAIIYNGQVVVDTSLSLRSMNHSQILSIRPIAVSSGETTQFSVKGFNLCQPAARLLFAFEGKYLLQEAASELQDFDDSLEEHDDLQCVKFSCSIPSVTGRGFVEIEDCGVPGSLFPFIVAENDVCSEICMLENALEFIEADDSDVHRTSKLEAKNQALEFINEMGWMLHRSRLRSKLGNLDPCMELFSFKRFKWLVEFSMDRDWCAVVKKLLDILFDGTVGAGEHPSVYRALLEMGLVHRAVRRNCRSLVELLLRYVPQSVSEDLGSELKSLIDGSKKTFLFRPDAEGPGGLTPLHIAAGKDGSEDVLDALTNDPGMVGIQVWKSARDSTGSTPEDYARLRGHYSYIHLVQKKINKRASPAHVVLDIPCALANSNDSQKHIKESSSSFEIGKMEEGLTQQSCKLCCQKLAYGMRNKSLLYRPAMLSMVAIAAVCVCVALLFKSCPEVLYVFRPFRWELLEYGSS